MKRNAYTYSAIFCFFLFSSVMSPLRGESKKPYKSTNEAMVDIFNSFSILLPYAANQMKFNDPNSNDLIVGHLSKIHNSFKSAKHLKRMNRPGFNPTYNIIVNHLDNTIKAFQNNNKPFARVRLRATTQMCMSCHTQLSNKTPSKALKSFKMLSQKDFMNNFEYGNYLFLTHQYKDAANVFEKEIEFRIENNRKLEQLHKSKTTHYLNSTVEKSLRRIITIYTKINYQPKKAIKLLKKYKSAPYLSRPLKQDIQDWLLSLKEWTKKKFNGKITNEKKLTEFITKYLAPLETNQSVDSSADIPLLIASGAMYKYLDKNSNSPQSGNILYWLSVVDKQFNFSSFFDLSEVYLKQCIINNQKTTIAKKCFNRLKENITIGYSGSSGTHIPKEERQELARLMRYID
jgi:hypothetical protein